MKNSRTRRMLAVVVPAMGLAVALVGAPAEQAFAQDNSGGTINIGGSIADTVTGAVSGIASRLTPAAASRRPIAEVEFGDDEGLAIADGSGGNHNTGATSK